MDDEIIPVKSCSDMYSEIQQTISKKPQIEETKKSSYKTTIKLSISVDGSMKIDSDDEHPLTK